MVIVLRRPGLSSATGVDGAQTPHVHEVWRSVYGEGVGGHGGGKGGDVGGKGVNLTLVRLTSVPAVDLCASRQQSRP